MSAPAVTDAPTPTPFDRDAAGAAYLALVDAYNATICAETDAIMSGDLARAKPAYEALAVANRTLADGLRSVAFPPELESTKSDLLRAFAAVEQSSRALANAGTVEEFNALFDAHVANQAAAAELSNFVRAELGLLSTPGGAC